MGRDRLRDLVHVDVVGDEANRIELHADLANPSALDLDLSRIGKSGQSGANDKVRQVPQHQWIGAGELVLQYGEDGGCEPFGAHVDAGWERRPQGRQPPLHLAQSELHVGPRSEVETELGCTAHRMRPDPAQIHDAAHGFFQWSRDRDGHLLRLEGSAASYHGNPWVGDLGINPRRERRERPHPAGREQPHRQPDGSPMAQRQTGQGHRFTSLVGAIRMPS